jgi:hypothetical protein
VGRWFRSRTKCAAARVVSGRRPAATPTGTLAESLWKERALNHMALNLKSYTSLRPYLFHGTERSNLASIREEFALHSASVLAPCEHAERGSFVRLKRGRHKILRVDFWELLRASPSQSPFFCKFNSGGPRTVAGRRSPRGPDTFLSAEEWPHTASRVAEVSFIGSLSLPQTTEIWDAVSGCSPLQRLSLRQSRSGGAETRE